ncbi:MAG: galactose-1-epimerase, partial [Muribaculaceae bacterium]|nr:galactose-1-epimerase [Muribaculaceae bacterium]
MKQLFLYAGTALIAASCGSGQQKVVAAGEPLDAGKFETEIDGKKTGLYTMRNAAGMEVSITNYGGRIVAINVPDKKGQMHDVVLGFDSIGAYLPEVNQSDFGAAIGRYANRINQGRINIDGQDYQ